MATNKDPRESMTPEEKENYDRVWYEQTLVSIAFMESHLLDEEGPLIQSQDLADALGSYVKAHRLQWTVSNLDKALADLSAAGTKFQRGTPIQSEVQSRQKEESERIQKESEAARATAWPWGATLEGKEGILRVKRMSGEDFKRFLNDKQFGSEFKRQTEGLHITDRQLSGRL